MQFKLGTEVEVTRNKGFGNSWYKATIIPPPEPNYFTLYTSTKSLWVEYETIFDNEEDPSKKLQEFTDISLIRPLPPTHSKDSNKFEKFDFVDVYREGGWFTGVLLHVFDDGSKYLVAFLNPYEEFVYGKDEIRVHLEWLGGRKWKKVCPVKKNVTFCPPKVGENVVASLPESTLGLVSSEEQASSPAKKVKRTASGDEEQASSPAKKVKRTASGDEEQASSPAKKVKRAASGDAVGRPSSDPNFVVQSVDAPPKFLQPCSLSPSKGDTHSNGKRKASEGQSYSPLSLSRKQEDIKKEDDSHFRSPTRGNQVTEVIDLTNEPDEVVDLTNEPEEVDEQIVAVCAPNGGATVVASPLESTPVVVGPVEQAPSPAKKLKPPNSTSLSLLAKDQEDKNKNDVHSPAKGNQVIQVVDAINEPENVTDDQGIRDRGSQAPVSSSEPASTECPKACPVTSCFSPQTDNSQSWPFTKKSEMWKVYGSMEVFKRIPQAPHFSPLNEHEEKSREKLALCMMSNFSYEAERISAGSPDDLNTSRIILDSLQSLEELEAHGFNITPLQDYLIELLFKIDKEKELNGELEEIESGIIKCRNEKTEIEVKLSELDEQLKSIEEKIECETSMISLTDLQLAELESQRGIVSKELHKIQLTKRQPFEGLTFP